LLFRQYSNTSFKKYKQAYFKSPPFYMDGLTYIKHKRIFYFYQDFYLNKN